MKHITQLLFCLFLSASLSAQITIEPDVVAFNNTADTFTVYIDVTNNTSEYADIFWTFDLGSNFPEEWSVTICDANTCYLENILQCSTLGPNEMPAGHSITLKFTINKNGVDGTSYGILHLFDDTKFENEVATSNPPPLSVNSVDVSSLSIYPNPTQDQISIKDDQFVGAIEVRTILGNLVYYQKHTLGQVHTMAHLPNGVFFVRLYNNNEKILKTMRLVKN